MRTMRSATSRLMQVGAALAVIAGLGVLAAQPASAHDDWYRHHHRHHPRVVFNYGPPVYYAPPPRVYYAPPAPVYYYPRPAYVYPAPAYGPAASLNFVFR